MAPYKPKKKVNSIRWTRREVRTLLKVLKEHGHHNIEAIARFIPTRTKPEIARYLRLHRRSALENFKKKSRLQHQDSLCLDRIHPWLPFINVHCPDDVEPHDPVVAYMLPVLEKYSKRSSVKYGEVHFKEAYRALFNSLMTQKFPEDLNRETFSMIYASFSTLHEEILKDASRDEKTRAVLKQCLQRCFGDIRCPEPNKKMEKDILKLPRVNVLQLTRKELRELCEN